MHVDFVDGEFVFTTSGSRAARRRTRWRPPRWPRPTSRPAAGHPRSTRGCHPRPRSLRRVRCRHPVSRKTALAKLGSPASEAWVRFFLEMGRRGCMTESGFRVRPARTSDVALIQELMEPLVQRRILLGKDAVVFYEAIQEFRIAEDARRQHDRLRRAARDVARTSARCAPSRSCRSGCARASGTPCSSGCRATRSASGSVRLFCLTFEVGLLRAARFRGDGRADRRRRRVLRDGCGRPDEGVAEFLDLARVKPNTLGNTRMLKLL